MDLPLGYNMPPAVQARMTLLLWISDQGGTAPWSIVDLGPLLSDRNDPEARATAGHLESLAERKLINLHKTIGFGGWSCDVLSDGLDLIERMQAQRDNAVQRRRAARDAFLRWLFERTVDGERDPDSSDFFTSAYGTFFGRPFTAGEIEAASDWLAAEGHLEGPSFDGHGVVRPIITNQGERIVENERSVNDDRSTPAPYSVTHVNVPGSGNNVAVNSSNVTQTTTVTMNEENSRQLLGLAESLAQVTNAGLLGLTEERTREAALVVESLRDVAAQDEAPGGVVRQLIDKVKDVAISGTGTAIGQTIVAAATSVGQALGLA